MQGRNVGVGPPQVRGGVRIPKALQGFFDLREGEAPTALRVGAVLALVVGAHTLLETARDTLFLTRLPVSRLTWVYALLAALSLVASALAGRFARQFGRRAAFVFSLAICAFVVVLFYLRPPTPAVVFAFYVSTGVMVTVLTIQFWMFLGELFTVAQGKRLYGPIGAGGVLGAVLGASLAAGLLRLLPVSALLLVAAALLLGAGALVGGIEGGARSDAVEPARGPFAWLADASAISKDRYVLRLGLLTALGTATVLVADYAFKSAAATRLAPARLGEFFALFYAANNTVALLVQLFVSASLVRRLGVTGAALVLPLLLALDGGAALLGGGFLAAVVAKGVDGSLRHSLHRVTSELLLLPVAAAQRDRARPFLETVCGRGVQALMAGLILALTAAGAASPRGLGITMGALASTWLLVAWRLRRPYVDLFRRALAAGSLQIEHHADLDLASLETLLETLSSPDEERVLAAIEIFVDTGHPRLLPALLLYHHQPRVLERALDVLSSAGKRDWVPGAERLLEHAEVRVRAAAVRALAAIRHPRAAQRGLSDESPLVRAYAVFFLAAHDSAAEPTGDPLVRSLLEDEASGFGAREALLGVIGEHGDERWRLVVRALLGRDRHERRLVAAAIQKTQDVELLPLLVDELDAAKDRPAVRDALTHLGAAAFHALVTRLADPQAALAVRVQIPKVIAGFGDQAALDALTVRLDEEPLGILRYKILRALGQLERQTREANGSQRLQFDRRIFRAGACKHLVEHLRVLALVVAVDEDDPRLAGSTTVGGVLLQLLRDKATQSLERAFRCLQIAHRNENLRVVYAALVRGDAPARSNAMEFLDALPGSSAELRELLRLVADPLAPSEQVRRATDLLRSPWARSQGAVDPPVGHDAALRRLLQDADELLAALAAHHVLERGPAPLAALAVEAIAARPALQELGARPDHARTAADV